MEETPQQSRRRKRQTSVTLQERARNHRIARVLVFFVALVLSFALGFIVRSQPAFLSALGFSQEGQADVVAGSSAAKETYNAVSARVEEVESLLDENSLDSYDLDAAAGSVVDALMKATGDPYAAYFSRDRYASYVKESANRPYAGVGALFADYNGRAYVVDVFEGSEAEAKGVRQGDFIEAIDGDASKDWTMTEVVNEFSRSEGESVVVTWMRPLSLDAETGTEFTTTLTSQRYEEPNVESELVDEVGYVKLRQITQTSASLVRQAVERLTSEGATSFVLDLRDNPGGYLTQAIDIASLFVPSGVLVQIEGVDGTTMKNAFGASITDAPLVVLTNEYTSAAAEVLAAALQDNQRAQILGQQTMGKGSVQVTRELSFGGAIRYTAAYYRSPLGHAINGEGVSPDVVVDAGSYAEEDVQKTIACDTARSSVRG